MFMKLASLFTDGMVFQREKPITIFGTGKGAVEVWLDSDRAEAHSEGGKWMVQLPARSAGRLSDMHIIMNGEETVLKDLLCGEVYLAGGQSNMEMPLFRTLGGLKEAAHSENDALRFFTVPRRHEADTAIGGWAFESVRNEDTPWQKCNEESANHFSAIGYYFGQMLQKCLQVPVGIISCNWGGTIIEAWIDPEHFGEYPSLIASKKQYAEDEALLANEPEAMRAAYAKDIEARARFCDESGWDMLDRVRESGLRGGIAKEILTWPEPLCKPYDQNRPGRLYRAMVSRVAPYSLRGVLWYQGESNAEDAQYLEKYGALMDTWRSAFRQDLPFLAVELAPYVRNNRWELVRGQQMKATKQFANNYLAGTSDIGDEYDIHPLEKDIVAERLFRLAAKHIHGFDMAADAPVLASCEQAGDKLELSFTETTRLFPRCGVRGVEIAGENGVFLPASGRAEGATLVLWNEAIPHPIHARYGFTEKFIYGSLYNEHGLPVHPFTTTEK